MSVITILSRKVIGFFFGILSIFKKLLCFLNIKRGRKNSGSILPMHTDVASIPQSVPSNEEVELESWDAWGEGDGVNPAFSTAASTQQQNRRPNIMPVFLSNKPEPEPEPDIDYFEDMTPQIRKTAKILLKKKEDNYAANGLSSRLAMTNDVHLAHIEDSTENLDNWQESENDGWSEEAMEDLSWQAESALKDTKRMERERRLQEHHRRKQEKEMARSSGKTGQFSVVKLS